jgi:hypothetical protein
MKACLLQHLWRLNRSFRCELFFKDLLLDFILFQSGYSIDLLREKKRPPPRRQNLDGFEPTTPAVPFKSRPFYRTKRGIIIIIIGFFALLAVIVGAVIGSKKKKSGGVRPNGTSSSQTANSIPHTNSAMPGNSSSRTFIWTITRSGVPVVTTSVYSGGVEIAPTPAPKGPGQ